MPRGGKRPGAGRKATGRNQITKIQIPCRVPPPMKEEIVALATRTGLSDTRQVEALLNQALKFTRRHAKDVADLELEPKYFSRSVEDFFEQINWALDRIPINEWGAKQHFALGRLIVHAAARVEAVLALTPGRPSGVQSPRGRSRETSEIQPEELKLIKTTPQSWSTHAFAIRTLQALIERVFAEIEKRLPRQLEQAEAVRATALGAEISWSIVHELDAELLVDDPSINKNASRILPDVARDLPWPAKLAAPKNKEKGGRRFIQPRPEIWPKNCPECNKTISNLSEADICDLPECPMYEKALQKLRKRVHRSQAGSQ